jgi:hypothetical protein
MFFRKKLDVIAAIVATVCAVTNLSWVNVRLPQYGHMHEQPNPAISANRAKRTGTIWPITTCDRVIADESGPRQYSHSVLKKKKQFSTGPLPHDCSHGCSMKSSRALPMSDRLAAALYARCR